MSTLDMNNKLNKALLIRDYKISNPTLSHWMWNFLFICEYHTKIKLRSGEIYEKKRFGGKKDLPFYGVETKNFLFIQQNPNKNSSYGKEAKDGKKIMWVIRREDDKYIGKVVDGELTIL